MKKVIKIKIFLTDWDSLGQAVKCYLKEIIKICLNDWDSLAQAVKFYLNEVGKKISKTTNFPGSFENLNHFEIK